MTDRTTSESARRMVSCPRLGARTRRRITACHRSIAVPARVDVDVVIEDVERAQIVFVVETAPRRQLALRA
jgi:predicted protein tyrosine phosphatase